MWDGPLAGLVVGVLLALIVAQLFRTFWPGVPPPFLAALTLSLAGVLAGQVWAWLAARRRPRFRQPAAGAGLRRLAAAPGRAHPPTIPLAAPPAGRWFPAGLTGPSLRVVDT